MVEKAKFIWFDGKMIPWDQAQVHVLTHTLHYGLGVFEGIRAYQCHDGRTAIFRLKEHTRRLFDSAHVMMLKTKSITPAANSCWSTTRSRPTSGPWCFWGKASWASTPRAARCRWPWSVGSGELIWGTRACDMASGSILPLLSGTTLTS